MSKTQAGPIVADRLKSFIERIERLKEEQKAIGSDVRDVFSEAKGVGYDPGTLRWLLKERELDAADRDERDALRDTYAHALGMAVSLVHVDGLSLRQAAKQAGVSKSSLHRALAVPAPSHDPETGEITSSRAAGGMDVQEGGQPPSAEPVPSAGAAGGADAPAPIQPQNGATGTAKPVGQVVPPEAQAPPTVEIGAVAEPKAERVAPNLYQRSQPVDDDLKIPHFLRRVPA